MTIHKSQGLSLDAAVIDARAAREPGQTYVALSRLRSLEGLHLKEMIGGVVTSSRALEFMREVEQRINKTINGVITNGARRVGGAWSAGAIKARGQR
jgi:ATP-dependent exoDNAse (exonuclease V) alpha subunit